MREGRIVPWAPQPDRDAVPPTTGASVVYMRALEYDRISRGQPMVSVALRGRAAFLGPRVPLVTGIESLSTARGGVPIASSR